ncbi:MAG: hypothetical protein ACYSRP_01705, partial [Planctomycetota bacterium]
MKKLVPFIVPLVMFCILAGYTGAQVAQADEEVMWTLVSIGDADGSEVDMTTIEGLTSAVNFTWVLLAAVLVFIMQAGFGFLGGFLQAKHMLNYLGQCFLDTTLAGLIFWL